MLKGMKPTYRIDRRVYFLMKELNHRPSYANGYGMCQPFLAIDIVEFIPVIPSYTLLIYNSINS